MSRKVWKVFFSSGCFIVMLIGNNLLQRHVGTRTAMKNLRTLVSLGEEERSSEVEDEDSISSSNKPNNPNNPNKPNNPNNPYNPNNQINNHKRKAFVCITGQLQRLILKPKYDSILKPILEEGYRIDVALVITGEEQQAHYTNKVRGERGGDFDTFQDAADYLRGKNTNITVVTTQPTASQLGENPKVPKNYLGSLDGAKRHTPEKMLARAQNHARIFESLSKCYDAMMTTSVTTYEIILRVRDDVAMDPPLDFKFIESMMSQNQLSFFSADKSNPLSSSTKTQTQRPVSTIAPTTTIWIPDCRCWGGINDRFAVVAPQAAKTYFNAPHQRFQAATNNTKFYPSSLLNPEKYLFDTYHRKNNIQIIATSRLRYVYKYHYSTTTTKSRTQDQNQEGTKLLEIVPGEHQTSCNFGEKDPYRQYGYNKRRILLPMNVPTKTQSIGGSNINTHDNNNSNNNKTEVVWVAGAAPKSGDNLQSEPLLVDAPEGSSGSDSVEDDALSSSSNPNKKNNNQKHKAFVCITGQLQRLILKPKYDSILKPILEEGYHIDVALAITGEENQAHYTNKVHGEGDFDTFQDAVNYLEAKNTNITVVTSQPTTSQLGDHPRVPHHYLKSLDCKHRHTPEKMLARAENHARIYESLPKCYDAMIATATTYQIVLRVRDDVAMDPPLDFKFFDSMMAQEQLSFFNAANRNLLSSRAATTATIWASDCRCWRGMNDRLAILPQQAAKTYFNAPHERFQKATNKTKFFEDINPEGFMFDTYHKKHNLQIIATSRLRYVYKYHFTASSNSGQDQNPSQEQDELKILEIIPGENITNCNLGEKNTYRQYGYHKRRISLPIKATTRSPPSGGSSMGTYGNDHSKTEVVWVSDSAPKSGISSSTNSNNNSNNQKKKAFVCITGQLQRLILKPKYDSILKPILQEGFHIDVALVLAAAQSKLYYTNRVVGETAGGDFDTFQDAVDYLQTKSNITVLTPQPTTSQLGEHPKVPKKYLRSLDSNWRHTPEQQLARAKNHARVYESLSKCYDSIMATATTASPYQIVLRVRDDALMDPPLDFNSIRSMMRGVRSSTPDSNKDPPSAKAMANSVKPITPNPSTILVTDCRCWGGMNDRLAILTPEAAKIYFTAPHERFQAATNKTGFSPSSNLNPEQYLFDTYHNRNKIQIIATQRLRHIYKYRYTATNSTQDQPHEERKALELAPGERKLWCDLHERNPFGQYGYHKRQTFSPNSTDDNNSKTEVVWVADVVPPSHHHHHRSSRTKTTTTRPSGIRFTRQQ